LENKIIFEVQIEPFDLPVGCPPQVFWCNFCDNNRVDSKDPETGHFFLQSGHIWNGLPVTPQSKMLHLLGERDVVSGNYHSVIFALCKECLTSKLG